MACEKYREELEEYAAGELDAAHQLELDTHLPVCAECREEFARQKLLYAAIDQGLRQRANEDLPLGFAARVRARVNAEASTAPRRGWFVAWTPAWTMAAAAAILLVVGLVLIRGSQQRNRGNGAELAKLSQPPVATSEAPPKNENPAPLAANLSRPVRRRLSEPRSVPPVANRSTGSAVPEVLVPPGQDRATVQLIGGLRNGDVPGDMLLANNRAIQFQPVVMPALEELKPLEQEQPRQ